MPNSKYNDLTHAVIGCAMKVHNTLGCGFQEVIYQRCLAIELKKEGLVFRREYEMPIYYDGHEVGTRRVDFVIEDKVLLEIKAMTSLEDVHYAQALNYLEVYKFEIGLLINFGAGSLQFKRLYSRKAKAGHKNNTGDPVNKNCESSEKHLNPENQKNPANPDTDNVLDARESRS